MVHRARRRPAESCGRSRRRHPGALPRPGHPLPQPLAPFRGRRCGPQGRTGYQAGVLRCCRARPRDDRSDRCQRAARRGCRTRLGLSRGRTAVHPLRRAGCGQFSRLRCRVVLGRPVGPAAGGPGRPACADPCPPGRGVPGSPRQSARRPRRPGGASAPVGRRVDRPARDTVRRADRRRPPGAGPRHPVLLVSVDVGYLAGGRPGSHGHAGRTRRSTVRA